MQEKNEEERDNNIKAIDTNKFEEVKVKTYQEVEPIKKQNRIDSYFDGSVIELIGWKLLSFLITLVTFGIGAPWGACMVYAFEINHTVYNGKRLKFEGTGGDLFVNIFKWILLSIITLGIYIIFIPIKKTRWVISNIHFEDEKFIKEDSFFDGKTIQLIGINIISYILNFVSLGLLSAFTYCYKLNWIIKHTVINRKKLVFTGKAISLFGKSLLWGFLTLITFGIYGLWVPIKKLKWQNKNIHIKEVGEETYKKDSSLYIAIPLLIVGIVIFSIVIPKFIKPIDVYEIRDKVESIFNDDREICYPEDNMIFVNLLGDSNSDNKKSKAETGVKSNSNTKTTSSTKSSTSTNSKTTSNTKSSTSSSDKILSGDFSKISGKYIDVFDGMTTLTLTSNGKVTIAGRVVTNKLSSIKKLSNGSYSCAISEGSIVIYPVGVNSSLGSKSKVRIEVNENGGALFFQAK